MMKHFMGHSMGTDPMCVLTRLRFCLKPASFKEHKLKPRKPKFWVDTGPGSPSAALQSSLTRGITPKRDFLRIFNGG